MTFGYERDIETLNAAAGRFEVYKQLQDFSWAAEGCMTRVGDYMYRIAGVVTRVDLTQVMLAFKFFIYSSNTLDIIAKFDQEGDADGVLLQEDVSEVPDAFRYPGKCSVGEINGETGIKKKFI